MEATFRTRLSLEGVGIVERKKAPMFTEFAKRFIEHVNVRNESKPMTVSFYAAKLSRLLEHSPLASVRLDKVDEALMSGTLPHVARKCHPQQFNRELAPLMKMLRLAETWKEMVRAPKIQL